MSGLLKRIHFVAVVVGIVVDTLGSFALSMAVMMMATGVLMADGVSIGEIPARLQSTPLLVAELVLGLGFTSFGGFTAGAIAKRDHVLQGALVGSACMLCTCVGAASVPSWYAVASLLGVLPAGIAGGWAAGRIWPQPTSDSPPATT